MSLDVPGLHGAHLRSELRESLGRRRVASLLSTGEVRGLWRGVVVESRRLLDPWTRAAAAQLSSGPPAVIAGVTAARLHGCRSVESAMTHIVMPYGHGVRCRGGLKVHHGGFFADDVVELDGVRVLALERVLADLLCAGAARDALALADEVLRHAGEDHEAFRKRVAATIEKRQDPRGTVRGPMLLDLASPRAESPAESWLRLQIVERGFPIPDVNWSLAGFDGREPYRLDLAWPDLRIALEYDGYGAHAGREAEDEARDDDLRRRGWVVIHVTRDDLVDLRRVDAELRAAFAKRGYTW